MALGTVGPRLDDSVIKASALSSATLHEASGRRGALPSFLKPLCTDFRLCGRALPVKAPPGDNLWLHYAIYEASPGEVLVVDVGEETEFGYWGEIMAVAANNRHIPGLVINGGVRDSLRMIAMKFPVFTANVCIRGTTKDPHGVGSIGDPIKLGDVIIERGDIIFGDADGVVVLPQANADRIIDDSYKRDSDERLVCKRLDAGMTTVEIYNLPVLSTRR